MGDLSAAVGLLPLVAAGAGVGFLVGLTGVGGGSLMTPLLISSFGISPQIAVGTDLLYASITKTAGSWRHHLSDHVAWPIVFRLAAGSLPAAALLLAAIAYFNIDTEMLGRWIRTGLVVALPLSAIAIVVYPFVTRTTPQEDLGDVPPRTIKTVLFGVALGLLVTLTSVGAGAIGVTVLATLYPMLPGEAPRWLRYHPRHAAHPGRRARPSRPWQCQSRPARCATMRVDSRHSHRRATCRRRSGTGAKTDPRRHALLRRLRAL